ncbi:hypothetical protein MMC30_006572 [Trapelia coarctata]|nr:hypothetical protein [Trapelia coarctata]
MRSFFSIWATLLLTIQISLAHDFPNLSKCLQKCVNQYSGKCKNSDVNCFCQLATGNFLEQVAHCHSDSCEDGLDLSALFTALDPICQIAGLPIPGAAITSADDVATGSSPTTVVVTKVVPTTDAGLVTIWRTSTSTPTLTATTILTLVTNKYGLIQTAEVLEYYDSATTIYGNTVIISKVSVTTAVRTVTTPSPLASTETVVVDTSSATDAISLITGTVLPLVPSSSTTTAVVVVTAAPTVVNGSPFSSQSAATGALSVRGLLMLGVGLLAGFLLI